MRRLPATVVGVDGKVLRAHFDPLTIQEEEALTMVLYSRADTWLGWGESREVDRPLGEHVAHLPAFDAWTETDFTRHDDKSQDCSQGQAGHKRCTAGVDGGAVAGYSRTKRRRRCEPCPRLRAFRSVRTERC